MATVNWDETVPADSDNLGQGDDVIRSLKTSIRVGLDSEHNWSAGGGADTGVHRLGSARAFFGPQSNVSSSGTDGRLMFTSNTSRLFAVGSGGTVLLGGQNVLSMGSAPSVLPQRHYWAQEVGASLTVAGNVVANFGSGFSGIPYVTASLWSEGIATAIPCAVTHLTTASATIIASSTGTIMWHSIGTRVL